MSKPYKINKFSGKDIYFAGSGYRMDYDKIRVTSAKPYKFVIDFLSRLIPRGEKICSLGCNSGVTEEKLAAGGFKVTAIDIATDMVNQCQEKLRKHDGSSAIALDLTNEQAMGRFSESNKGKFGAVFGGLIFEHFDAKQLPTVLGRISEILKPGGLFVTTAIDPNRKPTFFQSAKNFLTKASYRRYIKLKVCQLGKELIKWQDLSANYGYVPHSKEEFLAHLPGFKLVEHEPFNKGDLGRWGLSEDKMSFYVFKKN